MGRNFLNALKWWFIVGCLIFGIAAMNWDIALGFKTMAAFAGFGVFYILSDTWRDLPNVSKLVSIALVFISWLVAQHLPDILWAYSGYRTPLSFHPLWALLSFVIGVPAMMYVYEKYG